MKQTVVFTKKQTSLLRTVSASEKSLALLKQQKDWPNINYDYQRQENMRRECAVIVGNPVNKRHLGKHGPT
jgi:hypothetical protein